MSQHQGSPWKVYYTIFSAKATESFTLNSLNIIGKNLGAKNFSILWLRISTAGNTDLNNGQTAMIVSCTIQGLYKVPGLLLTTLIFLFILTFLQTSQDHQESF